MNTKITTQVRISPPPIVVFDWGRSGGGQAHQRLDTAVFAAYGWQNDLSDEEILEKLLALNLERA